MMHVSVMMMLMQRWWGHYWRSHFLLSRGMNRGSSVGTGGYRHNGYRTPSTDLVAQSQVAAEQSAMARLIENNGNGKTRSRFSNSKPSQTVMAIDESLLHEHLSASVLPKRWITSAIASLDWDFLC